MSDQRDGEENLMEEPQLEPVSGSKQVPTPEQTQNSRLMATVVPKIRFIERWICHRKRKMMDVAQQQISLSNELRFIEPVVLQRSPTRCQVAWTYTQDKHFTLPQCQEGYQTSWLAETKRLNIWWKEQ